MRCKAGMLGANRENGWQVSTAAYVRSLSVSGKESSPRFIAVSTDGTRFYIGGDVVSGSTGQRIHEYSMSTAHDISTASYVRTLNVQAQDTAPRAVAFKPDGTVMYMTGDQGNDVSQYALSTAWDISTATYSQGFSVASQDTRPEGIAFSADGTQMYVVGENDSEVNQYALSAAWDISAASYVRTFSVAAEATVPVGIAFKYDGTRMYVVGSTQSEVNQYTLSTPWDLSSASYGENFIVSAQDTLPRGIAFSQDGTEMYVVGAATSAIKQYAIP